MSIHRALAERFATTLTDHDLDAAAELLVLGGGAVTQAAGGMHQPADTRCRSRARRASSRRTISTA